jgi:hypothetical protein
MSTRWEEQTPVPTLARLWHMFSCCHDTCLAAAIALQPMALNLWSHDYRFFVYVYKPGSHYRYGACMDTCGASAGSSRFKRADVTVLFSFWPLFLYSRFSTTHGVCSHNQFSTAHALECSFSLVVLNCMHLGECSHKLFSNAHACSHWVPFKQGDVPKVPNAYLVQIQK